MKSASLKWGKTYRTFRARDSRAGDADVYLNEFTFENKNNVDTSEEMESAHNQLTEKIRRKHWTSLWRLNKNLRCLGQVMCVCHCSVYG